VTKWNDHDHEAADKCLGLGIKAHNHGIMCKQFVALLQFNVRENLRK